MARRVADIIVFVQSSALPFISYGHYSQTMNFGLHTTHYTVYSFAIRTSIWLFSYIMCVQAHVSEIDLPWWRDGDGGNNQFNKKMILIAGFSYIAKNNVNERINRKKYKTNKKPHKSTSQHNREIQ